MLYSWKSSGNGIGPLKEEYKSIVSMTCNLEPNEAKEVVTDVASSKEVATKTDITELKAATKADIAELKTETKADIKDMATKTDLANLEAKLVEKNGKLRN